MIPVLEIGGTHVTAALVDLRDGVVCRVRRPLNAQGDATDILDALRDTAASLPTVPGARWGVALPGPFDYVRGVGLFTGVGKFDALCNVNVRAALLKRLRPRPAGIVFVNDAHAFLTGEWRVGTVRGHRRAAGVTLGTGVGSAFITDGRICENHRGIPPEGRIDLTKIDGLPLEVTVSRRAIIARYGDPAADVRDIAERAREGEAKAHHVLHDTFTRLGAALGPFLVNFGATALAVGGTIARSWDLVSPALLTGLTAGGWAADDAHACENRSQPGAGKIFGEDKTLQARLASSASPPRGLNALRIARADEDAALIGAAHAVTHNHPADQGV
ncbi:ROK family protein (plasmid) [Streptomyces sp. AHU1]|uniref:ROK family protein n=1 Tax=Streptomyces sp. AHU1 TaxID=3377215 RepID=UPI003877E8EF